MAHRSEDQHHDHFDLLPFIAILMCTLGTLLLVTMSIAALSVGPAAGEGWIPARGPQRISKTPILIEWDGSAATIHPNSRKIQVMWSGQTNDNPDLQTLLDELSRQRNTHYALFAVRPSGFASFNRFVAEFRKREINVGYEPIDQERPVRLLWKEPQP